MKLLKTLLIFSLITTPTITHANVLLPEDSDSGFMGLVPDFLKSEKKPTPKVKIKKKPAPAPAAPSPSNATINNTNPSFTTIKNDLTIKLDPVQPPAPIENKPFKIEDMTADKLNAMLPKNLSKFFPKNMDKILEESLGKLKEMQGSIGEGIKYGKTINTAGQQISLKPGGISTHLDPNSLESRYAEVLNNMSPEKRAYHKKHATIFNDYEKKLKKEGYKGHMYIKDITVRTFDSDDLKKQITITSMPNYIWGEQDLKIIEQTLGYKRNDVPKYCQLRHVATIHTDDGQYPQNSNFLWGETAISLKYNGNLKTADFRPMAVCYPPKELPYQSAFIRKVGDKYGVQLIGQDNCTPPQTLSYVNNLYLKYIGNGKVQCKFQ